MSKRILVLLLIISLVIITFCTKKTTTPEEQLLPPTDLTISLVENNKIQLTWVDNSTNEIKFTIDRKRGIEDWFNNYNEVSENITLFNDIIPTNSDTIYSYRLKAFDGENYSAYSDTIAWFSINSAPSNLQLEQIAQDTLKLTWQDNSIGEEYFRIDRKIDEKGWQMDYAHVPADTTNFLDYTTALYDTCNYKIFAVRGISHSDSTENSFIPFLPAPSNLQLHALGATEVKLTWQDNCHNEDGYRFFFKRGETALLDSLNLPINTQEYSDENVIPGVLNYYKVCAYYKNDTSGFIENEINTLPAPSNLTSIAIDGIKIRLSWEDNCNFEEGYKIERKINGENYELLNTVGENDTSFIDENVEPLMNYYYRVCGYFLYFQSHYSNEATATWPQGILHVPDEYPTIQAAINSSVDSNIILVQPGTYIENINFYGKKITVGSLYMFTNNSNYISQTIIDGGQIETVVTFDGNEDSTSVLNGFTITNGMSSSGGGINCCSNASPKLKNLIISNNTTSWDGAGINCESNSNPTIMNVRISNNSARRGGGIYCINNSNPLLLNVIISHNAASDKGGGILCWYNSNLNIENTTIIGNSALEGSGIWCGHDSHPIVMNSIFWKDSKNEVYFESEYTANSITIKYSNILGGEAGIVANNNGSVYWLEGNINENPIFVDPENGDFHLQPGSPCIDAGNPDPQYNDPDSSRNDMGAYGGHGGDW